MLNDLREADWIYPAANDRTTWHEIKEEHWDDMLNVLPPIYAPSGFLMSEAAAHDSRGVAVRAYFVRVAGRYFVREVAQDGHSEALAELHAELRHE